MPRILAMGIAAKDVADSALDAKALVASKVARAFYVRDMARDGHSAFKMINSLRGMIRIGGK